MSRDDRHHSYHRLGCCSCCLYRLHRSPLWGRFHRHRLPICCFCTADHLPCKRRHLWCLRGRCNRLWLCRLCIPDYSSRVRRLCRCSRCLCCHHRSRFGVWIHFDIVPTCRLHRFVYLLCILRCYGCCLGRCSMLLIGRPDSHRNSHRYCRHNCYRDCRCTFRRRVWCHRSSLPRRRWCTTLSLLDRDRRFVCLQDLCSKVLSPRRYRLSCRADRRLFCRCSRCRVCHTAHLKA